jgi:hypothetical protein
VTVKILTPIDRSEYREKVLVDAISPGESMGSWNNNLTCYWSRVRCPGGKVKEKEREREEDAKREAETLVLNAIDPLIRKDRVNIKKEVVENLILLPKSIISYAKK